MTSLKDELGFFVSIPESLVERAAEIGTNALAMFVYLRYRTNRKRHEAWPGYWRIAADLGWGRTRIAEAIQALEDGGYLERRRRFGETTVYVLKRSEPPDMGGESDSSPETGLLKEE